jgi:hypothetical protein
MFTLQPLSRIIRYGKAVNRNKPEDLPDTIFITELSGERPEMRALLAL